MPLLASVTLHCSSSCELNLIYSYHNIFVCVIWLKSGKCGSWMIDSSPHSFCQLVYFSWKIYFPYFILNHWCQNKTRKLVIYILTFILIIDTISHHTVFVSLNITAIVWNLIFTIVFAITQITVAQSPHIYIQTLIY